MSLPNIDASRPEFRYPDVANVSYGFARSADVLKQHFPDLVVSKQKLRRADAIACVRLKRQEANQNLGFASRPFVLCGLPVKKPKTGQLLHDAAVAELTNMNISTATNTSSEEAENRIPDPPADAKSQAVALARDLYNHRLIHSAASAMPSDSRAMMDLLRHDLQDDYRPVRFRPRKPRIGRGESAAWPEHISLSCTTRGECDKRATGAMRHDKALSNRVKQL